MKRQWTTKIAVLMFGTIMAVSTLASCGKKEQPSAQEQEQAAAEAAEQAEQAGNEAVAQAEETENEAVAQAEEAEDVLQEFTGEMDLSGSWDDEVSQRASMDVTRNEDGSYNILVHWGGSATETAIWEIHGVYDETSGMLTYDDGAYSIHTITYDNQETVSDQETTKGSFMKEGDKLRWSDSKNSEDGIFVKVQ